MNIQLGDHLIPVSCAQEILSFMYGHRECEDQDVPQRWGFGTCPDELIVDCSCGAVMKLRLGDKAARHYPY